jgi:hypothetical protein
MIAPEALDRIFAELGMADRANVDRAALPLVGAPQPDWFTMARDLDQRLEAEGHPAPAPRRRLEAAVMACLIIRRAEVIERDLGTCQAGSA